MASTIDFPSNIGNPAYPLGEQPENAVLSSKMEDGTVKTRPKFTRNRATYTLQWPATTNEVRQAFDTFYKTTLKNGALSFNWTHPSTNESLVVRFTEPPTYSNVYTGYWTISAKLQEV